MNDGLLKRWEDHQKECLEFQNKNIFLQEKLNFSEEEIEKLREKFRKVEKINEQLKDVCREYFSLHKAHHIATGICFNKGSLGVPYCNYEEEIKE